MNAVMIPISSPDELAGLRRQAVYGLAIDASAPNRAYVCRQCGAILGFTGAFDLIRSEDVDCPQCGAFNTLEAA